MDRQRNQRIAALFEEALDLPPEEQVALLARKCRDEAERRAVERLLEAEKAVRAEERAGAPLDLRLAASYSILMRSGSAPLAAAAGGGSTGGSSFLGTTAVETPSGGAGAGSTTDVTAVPRKGLPAPEPRRCAIDIGAVIGPYRVIERIGEGGMGVVFAVRHEGLGHDAVIKVLLHQGMTDSDESVQRFMDEARIAAGIRHPGVVQVIHVGRHETGALYIVMERLHGESLQARLRRKGKLPPRIAVSFALQTARALDAVHARGVVHRDLKPDNLYLVEDAEVPGGERVKILDFGIAKLHSRPTELTQNNVTMGTPPYMAPEQCMGAARVDSRADLYSLGVLLFQMLCGRLPFRCQSFGEYIFAHTQKTPPSVQEFTRVSPALANLVARLLAKRPEDRFASARALVRALKSVPDLTGGRDGSGAPLPSDAVWRASTQEQQPEPSSRARTILAHRGSRPSAGRVWPRSMPAVDTEPEASEPSVPVFAVFSNTRPEPVEEPAATIPVVVEPPDAPSPIVRTQRGQPLKAKADTLDAVPAEAALATQRLGVGATLRWVYGLVPAGGFATLVVAVSMALVVNGASGVTSIFKPLDQTPDAGVEDARVVKPDEALRQEIVTLFENGSEAVQRELIDATRDVGTSGAVEILYQGLGSSSDIRRAAGDALCALGWRDGVPRLRDAMRQSGGSLRVQLTAALLCLEDREAIVPLAEALDEDVMVQLTAAEALARAGQRELALPVLQRKRAGIEPGSAPWLRVARGLLLLDDAGARAALLGELARPEPARTLAAAEILAGAGDREALAYLGRVLADAAFTHRAEAAVVLARHLGDSQVAGFADPLLAFGQGGLGSRHAHERRAAAVVMGRLAGHGEYLDAAGLEALRKKLETLQNDNDSTPDAEERAARLTARVALLAVYRALEARNHHE